ncbi:MAG: anaerobic ribonucleoside-triphosphate reductase activating protein [Candidatus Thorarchaeota archaeon]|nr:MAG: anaerobic ribonucleoside-triphosphate reductase activating protein [Candidatus Thorarchaeota archaeon]
MRIASVIDISLVDVPKIPVTVIFTAGCNMDCPFCQNAEIIPLKSGTPMKIPEIVERVQGNMSDGYCITGGEPTIHRDLPDLLKALRDTGTSHINLNTQGTVPSVLKRCLPYLDSVWFDLKTVPERYAEVTRARSDPWPHVLKSMKLLLDSSVAFWPRTTYVGRWMHPEEIQRIAEFLADLGFEGGYLVQNYIRSSGTRELETEDFEEPSSDEIEQIRERLPPTISLKIEWR